MSPESFAPLSLDPAATCDDCGRTGAFRFATATLCTDCYQQRGACCAEHAGHDLTCQAETAIPPRSHHPPATRRDGET